MLAAGIAKGMRQQRKSSAQDNISMNELLQLDDSSDSDYDF